MDPFTAWISPSISGLFLVALAFFQRKINAKDVIQNNFNETLEAKIDTILLEQHELKEVTNRDRNNLTQLQFDTAAMMKENQSTNLRILEEMEKITSIQSNLFVMMKVQEKLKERDV